MSTASEEDEDGEGGDGACESTELSLPVKSTMSTAGAAGAAGAAGRAKGVGVGASVVELLLLLGTGRYNIHYMKVVFNMPRLVHRLQSACVAFPGDLLLFVACATPPATVP